MDWLLQIDVALFRFLNERLANPAFDWFMPAIAGNPLFLPLVLAAAVALIWKGGTRGRVFVLLMALTIALTDGVVCNTLKHAIGRARPFDAIGDVRLLLGRGGSGSMPSSHTANWFAVATVLWFYYRRAAFVAVPFAVIMGFSRVYNGVHFPSDVLVGALLGTGCGLGVVLGGAGLWRKFAPRIVPEFSARMPSLLKPEPAPVQNVGGGRKLWEPDSPRWTHAGLALLGGMLLVRWAYIAAGKIGLSGGEARHWLIAKGGAELSHLDSPAVVWLVSAGTALFGDTEFGVRFFAPVLSALTGWLALWFVAREFSPRAGFFLVVAATTTPLFAAEAILMVGAPVTALLWMVVLTLLWKGVCATSTVRRAVWGALALGAYWAGNHWGADRPPFQFDFHLDRTVRFLLGEILILHPIYLVGGLMAAAAMVRTRSGSRAGATLLFLLAMSLPLGIASVLLAVLSGRSIPDGVLPAAWPLLMLAAGYWERRWRDGDGRSGAWFRAAWIAAVPVVVLMHDTNLVGKLVHRPLPAAYDPLAPLRVGPGLAAVAGAELDALRGDAGPAFVIAKDDETAALLTFYLPEAKAAVGNARSVTTINAIPPRAQREQLNAIFIRMTRGSRLAPPIEWESFGFSEVRRVGVRDVLYRGRVLDQVEIYTCRTAR